MFASLDDMLEHAELSFVERRLFVALEELSKTQDGVERRSELVTHRGKKFTLRRTGRFGGRLCLAKLDFPPHVVRQIPNGGDGATFRRPAVGDPPASPVSASIVDGALRIAPVREPALAKLLGRLPVDAPDHPRRASHREAR